MVESEIPIEVDIKFEYFNREPFVLWTKGFVELLPKGKFNIITLTAICITLEED